MAKFKPKFLIGVLLCYIVSEVCASSLHRKLFRQNQKKSFRAEEHNNTLLSKLRQQTKSLPTQPTESLLETRSLKSMFSMYEVQKKSIALFSALKPFAPVYNTAELVLKTVDDSNTIQIIKTESETLWAYSYRDGRVAFLIVSFNSNNEVVRTFYKPGARYLESIRIEKDLNRVVFTGEFRRVVTLSFDEIFAKELPPTSKPTNSPTILDIMVTSSPTSLITNQPTNQVYEQRLEITIVKKQTSPPFDADFVSLKTVPEQSDYIPILITDDITLWAYSFNDGLEAFLIVAFDNNGEVKKTFYKSGAKNLAGVEINENNNQVIFHGEGGKKVKLEYSEIFETIAPSIYTPEALTPTSEIFTPGTSKPTSKTVSDLKIQVVMKHRSEVFPHSAEEIKVHFPDAEYMPVLLAYGEEFWAYNYNDGREAIQILSFDMEGNVMKSFYKPGVKDVTYIEIDQDAEEVIFIGKDGKRLQVSLDELLHSNYPSTVPSNILSFQPSSFPSGLPSIISSNNPTVSKSNQPSLHSSGSPSDSSAKPSGLTTLKPTSNPTTLPTILHSSLPSKFPSSTPSNKPSLKISTSPSFFPSYYGMRVIDKDIDDIPSYNHNDLYINADNDSGLIPVLVAGGEEFWAFSHTDGTEAFQIVSFDENGDVMKIIDKPGATNLQSIEVDDERDVVIFIGEDGKSVELSFAEIYASNFPSSYPSQIPSSMPSSLPSLHPSFLGMRVIDKDIDDIPSYNQDDLYINANNDSGMIPVLVAGGEEFWAFSHTDGTEGFQIVSFDENGDVMKIIDKPGATNLQSIEVDDGRDVVIFIGEDGKSVELSFAEIYASNVPSSYPSQIPSSMPSSLPSLYPSFLGMRVIDKEIDDIPSYNQDNVYINADTESGLIPVLTVGGEEFWAFSHTNGTEAFQIVSFDENGDVMKIIDKPGATNLHSIEIDDGRDVVIFIGEDGKSVELSFAEIYASNVPSSYPSQIPSSMPSYTPSLTPTSLPSLFPSHVGMRLIEKEIDDIPSYNQDDLYINADTDSGLIPVLVAGGEEFWAFSHTNGTEGLQIVSFDENGDVMNIIDKPGATNLQSIEVDDGRDVVIFIGEDGKSVELSFAEIYASNFPSSLPSLHPSYVGMRIIEKEIEDIPSYNQDLLFINADTDSGLIPVLVAGGEEFWAFSHTNGTEAFQIVSFDENGDVMKIIDKPGATNLQSIDVDDGRDVVIFIGEDGKSVELSFAEIYASNVPSSYPSQIPSFEPSLLPSLFPSLIGMRLIEKEIDDIPPYNQDDLYINADNASGMIPVLVAGGEEFWAFSHTDGTEGFQIVSFDENGDAMKIIDKPGATNLQSIEVDDGRDVVIFIGEDGKSVELSFAEIYASNVPSSYPSILPSNMPSYTPSLTPTSLPSLFPSHVGMRIVIKKEEAVPSYDQDQLYLSSLNDSGLIPVLIAGGEEFWAFSHTDGTEAFQIVSFDENGDVMKIIDKPGATNLQSIEVDDGRDVVIFIGEDGKSVELSFAEIYASNVPSSYPSLMPSFEPSLLPTLFPSHVGMRLIEKEIEDIPSYNQDNVYINPDTESGLIPVLIAGGEEFWAFSHSDGTEAFQIVSFDENGDVMKIIDKPGATNLQSIEVDDGRDVVIFIGEDGKSVELSFAEIYASNVPSSYPSQIPSSMPSYTPSLTPTSLPSLFPSHVGMRLIEKEIDDIPSYNQDDLYINADTDSGLIPVLTVGGEEFWAFSHTNGTEAFQIVSFDENGDVMKIIDKPGATNLQSIEVDDGRDVVIFIGEDGKSVELSFAEIYASNVPSSYPSVLPSNMPSSLPSLFPSLIGMRVVIKKEEAVPSYDQDQLYLNSLNDSGLIPVLIAGGEEFWAFSHTDGTEAFQIVSFDENGDVMKIIDKPGATNLQSIEVDDGRDVVIFIGEDGKSVELSFAEIYASNVPSSYPSSIPSFEPSLLPTIFPSFVGMRLIEKEIDDIPPYNQDDLYINAYNNSGMIPVLVAGGEEFWAFSHTDGTEAFQIVSFDENGDVMKIIDKPGATNLQSIEVDDGRDVVIFIGEDGKSVELSFAEIYASNFPSSAPSLSSLPSNFIPTQSPVAPATPLFVVISFKADGFSKDMPIDDIEKNVETVLTKLYNQDGGNRKLNIVDRLLFRTVNEHGNVYIDVTSISFISDTVIQCQFKASTDVTCDDRCSFREVSNFKSEFIEVLVDQLSEAIKDGTFDEMLREVAGPDWDRSNTDVSNIQQEEGSSNTSSKTRAGGIIGAAFGCIAFVGVAAVFLLKSRRRKEESYRWKVRDNGNELVIYSFSDEDNNRGNTHPGANRGPNDGTPETVDVKTFVEEDKWDIQFHGGYGDDTRSKDSKLTITDFENKGTSFDMLSAMTDTTSKKTYENSVVLSDIHEKIAMESQFSAPIVTTNSVEINMTDNKWDLDFVKPRNKEGCVEQGDLKLTPTMLPCMSNTDIKEVIEKHLAAPIVTSDSVEFGSNVDKSLFDAESYDSTHEDDFTQSIITEEESSTRVSSEAETSRTDTNEVVESTASKPIMLKDAIEEEMYISESQWDLDFM